MRIWEILIHGFDHLLLHSEKLTRFHGSDFATQWPFTKMIESYTCALNMSSDKVLTGDCYEGLINGSQIIFGAMSTNSSQPFSSIVWSSYFFVFVSPSLSLSSRLANQFFPTVSSDHVFSSCILVPFTSQSLRFTSYTKRMCRYFDEFDLYCSFSIFPSTHTRAW